MTEREARLAALVAQAEQGGSGLPPVDRWHPAHNGRIDIRIAVDGTWYHEGEPIRRDALVRVFSSILRRDDDGIVLVTPAERLLIEVDDAPFMAVTVEQLTGEQGPRLLFTTLSGDAVIAGPEHRLWVELTEDGEPRPYLHVRGGLNARLHRNVFYQLVEWAQPREQDDETSLWVESDGASFLLGTF
ncbi:DUF1285 domain-containing protein [Isoalcanivorax beigongshangi]|uniref:DUF1285 domain-containing protein n=1 Tax=Isoalcanivorax beigongshangi TaxID=3238810 RepID=A0ABV4AGN3_9GAMM